MSAGVFGTYPARGCGAALCAFARARSSLRTRRSSKRRYNHGLNLIGQLGNAAAPWIASLFGPDGTLVGSSSEPARWTSEASRQLVDAAAYLVHRRHRLRWPGPSTPTSVQVPMAHPRGRTLHRYTDEWRHNRHTINLVTTL